MKDYQLVLRVSMRCADDAQARARAKTVLGAATLGSFAQSVKLQRLEPGRQPRGIPLDASEAVVPFSQASGETYTWEVWCQLWEGPCVTSGCESPEVAESLVRKIRSVAGRDKLYPHLAGCGCIPKNTPCRQWETMWKS